MSIKYYLILCLLFVFAVLGRAQTVSVDRSKIAANAKPLEPKQAVLQAFDDYPYY